MTITAPPISAARSSASSSLERGGVQHRRPALASAASRPARMISRFEESIESGTPTIGAELPDEPAHRLDLLGQRCEYSSTLTSRNAAPAATCPSAIGAQVVEAEPRVAASESATRTALRTCLTRPSSYPACAAPLAGSGSRRVSAASSANAIDSRPSSSGCHGGPGRRTTRVVWMFSPITTNGCDSSAFPADLPGIICSSFESSSAATSQLRSRSPEPASRSGSGLNWQPSTKSSKKSGVSLQLDVLDLRERARSSAAGADAESSSWRAPAQRGVADLDDAILRHGREEADLDRVARRRRSSRSRRRGRGGRRRAGSTPSSRRRIHWPTVFAALAWASAEASARENVMPCSGRDVDESARGRRTRLSALIRPARRSSASRSISPEPQSPSGARVADRLEREAAVGVAARPLRWRRRRPACRRSLSRPRRPARRGSSRRRMRPVAGDDDLGVGADVDQHRDARRELADTGGDEVGGDVGAHVAGDQRRAPDARLRDGP